VAQHCIGLFKMQEMTDARHHDALESLRERRLHAFAKLRGHAAVVLPMQIERRDSNWTARAGFKGQGCRIRRRREQLPVIGQGLGQDSGLAKRLVERGTVRRRQHVPRRPFSPEPVEECKVVELNSRLRQASLEEEHLPASPLLIAIGDECCRQSLSIGDCQPDKLADAGRIEACRGVDCARSEVMADEISRLGPQHFNER
jgi:hypothetical protein